MSVESPKTVERPRKIPLELREKDDALNLDIIDLPVRDRFLIVASVLSGREREKGLHWRQFRYSSVEPVSLRFSELPPEIAKTLKVVGSDEICVNLKVYSRVQLLDKYGHSENEIAIGFDDQEGKVLVYKFDDRDNFITRRRKKTPISRMTLEYRHTGILRERKDYRGGYVREMSELESLGVFDDVEGAFSRLTHFLNFCSLRSPIYGESPII